VASKPTYREFWTRGEGGEFYRWEGHPIGTKTKLANLREAVAWSGAVNRALLDRHKEQTLELERLRAMEARLRSDLIWRDVADDFHDDAIARTHILHFKKRVLGEEGR
jgi:hypothetical protein